MPSTYTTNLGIEKIESGAQTGVWGTTTNTNLDIIDQAVNGVHVETLAVPGNSSSPNTLPITDGATSAGRNKFIEFNDGGDLGATAYVQITPNDAEKVVFMRNSLSGGRSVIVFQGTYNASNDFEIPNGADVVLKLDGGGVGAVVTNVFDSLKAGGISLASGSTVTSILDEDDMASDSATALATQQSIKAYVDASGPDFTSIATDVRPTTDDNNDLGSSTKRWQDLYLSGGMYVGGTTSANFLDDYEEGTWSPTLLAGMTGTISTITATYTKIGRQVSVRLVVDGTSLAVSSAAVFRSLPFTLYNPNGLGLDFFAISGGGWTLGGSPANQWSIGASITGSVDFNFGPVSACDKVYGAGTYETI